MPTEVADVRMFHPPLRCDPVSFADVQCECIQNCTTFQNCAVALQISDVNEVADCLIHVNEVADWLIEVLRCSL